MNFEEFEKKIKEDLPSVLPDRLKDAKIESREVEKLQGASYKGITISPENEKIVPTINMSEIYHRYEQGMPYEEALRGIVEIAENEKYRPLEVDASLFHDYSRLKETLTVQVVDTERNQEMLSKLPHKELEDMSLVYRFDLGTDRNGTQSIVITNHLLDVYGITAEQLHQDAMEIAPEGHPLIIKPMSMVMGEIMKDTAATQEQIDAAIGGMEDMPEMMYVASVTGGNLGAGVITYPDFMEKGIL